MADGLTGWIKLTHIVDGKPKDVYVKIDQIVSVADAMAGVTNYATTITLASGFANVRESVADVMALIAGQGVSV